MVSPSPCTAPAALNVAHLDSFTVVAPARLEGETLDALEHVLEVHRPAHTTVAGICSVEAGMRVGVGLYTELTSVVGRTSGFGQLRVAGSVVGRHDVLGRPGPGTRPGSSRLGEDTRIA